jgi:hypothetical protein
MFCEHKINPWVMLFSLAPAPHGTVALLDLSSGHCGGVISVTAKAQQSKAGLVYHVAIPGLVLQQGLDAPSACGKPADFNKALTGAIPRSPL